MINYLIEENFKESENIEGYTKSTVSVISEKEFKQKVAFGELSKNEVLNYKNAKCCRLVVSQQALLGSFSIISKDKKMERNNFSFIIKKNNVTFIDNGNTVISIIKKVIKNKIRGNIKIGRFLYEFLETIILSDLRYIEELSDRLIKIESAVSRGITDDFNRLMSAFSKETMLFYRYYTQLADVGDELQENENNFFSEEDVHFFEKFTHRADKLREELLFLRESSDHVRDIYSGQIDTKMNKIMKVLTIVTTVCTPISISTSWFGMSFPQVAEQEWPYAYFVFILGNILAMFGCFWYLKKKKFL